LHKKALIGGDAFDPVDSSSADRVRRRSQSAGAEDRGRIDAVFRAVRQRDRANAASRRRLQQPADIATKMERIVGVLKYLIGRPAKRTELLAGAMRRTRLRPGRINASPIAVIVRPNASGRAEIIGENIARNCLRRRALDKHDVVRAGRFIERERRVHVADIESKRKWPLVEPVIGNKRGLDATARCAGR
jgi:hypothetical protein